MQDVLDSKPIVPYKPQALVSEGRLALRGEFDLFNRDELSATLQDDALFRTIIIDLTHVTYIDASIIGALVAHAARRKARGASPIQIVNAQQNIRRLFTLCKLESVFRFDSFTLASRASILGWIPLQSNDRG